MILVRAEVVKNIKSTMENKTKNKYIYPVKVDDSVKITRDESPAHVDNLKYSVDFIMEEGREVFVALDGVVVDIKTDSEIGGESQKLDELGNFIEIKHDNDEYSIYEHLKKDGSVVEIGDKVKQGQVIGHSGATGWLAHLGPHLHFMVGKYADEAMDYSTYETLEIIWDKSIDSGNR